MKEWKEYLFKVNGFEMTAVYNEDTIQKVFLPLLKQLQQLQKEKKERIQAASADPRPLQKGPLHPLYRQALPFWNIYQNKIKSLQTFKH